MIHALLTIGDGAIMVSDTQPSDPVDAGASVQVCLDFSDADDMARRFDALAAGGRVTMPLADTFWGATFGTLTDAYGIRRMFNCTRAAAAKAG